MKANTLTREQFNAHLGKIAETSPAQFRAIMDAFIASTSDPDAIAHAEFLREWHDPKPGFREAVADMVWECLA